MTEEIKVGKKDVVACNYWKACDYYKQLKRLEQENKELKEMLSKEPKAMQAFQIAYSGLKKENEVLWGMVKDYKTAFEEINKIAEPRFVNGLNEEADLCNLAMDRIQNKINEVLGNEGK
jgi:3-deoxy-D-manno-octulosonic-acid transferase